VHFTAPHILCKTRKEQAELERHALKYIMQNKLQLLHMCEMEYRF